MCIVERLKKGFICCGLKGCDSHVELTSIVESGTKERTRKSVFESGFLADPINIQICIHPFIGMI